MAEIKVAKDKQVVVPVAISYNPIAELPTGEHKGIFVGYDIVERELPKKNLCFILLKVGEEVLRVFAVLKSATAPKLKGGQEYPFKCAMNGQWKNATIIL